MKRGQLLLALFAALAVAGVAWFAGSGGGDKDETAATKVDSGAPAPKNAIKVSFAYSPEKEKLLLPLIKAFNNKGEEVGGRKVFVEGINAASGDAEARIAKGTFKPVAWSPASSLWGRLLNFEADQPLTPEEAPSIVRTPLVIAMWEPMARALGYPKKKLGFADVLKLATSGKGWADFGRPEFGEFKLVHTSPDFSTSGLSAVVAEYYAATGKKEGLTEQDIAGGAGAQARARHRALDRPLRGHDAVHRRAAQEGGPGLRERGRDGGGHAARLQPRPQAGPRQARRDLSRGGHVRLRLAVLHDEGAVGLRRAGGGRQGVPGVPGR